MRNKGTIFVHGIVQGVGFRPFVYAAAHAFGIRGTVRNLGSQVEIHAFGDRFEEFLAEIGRGTPLSRIDRVVVGEIRGPPPDGFVILESSAGALSGFIPADVALCDECRTDIFSHGGRYERYWATSCVNCGPRYSIIDSLPYDRERTTMEAFPPCTECTREYNDPGQRRHHAQTIACARCGPSLTPFDTKGVILPFADPVRETARLLDEGSIVAIRGIGGFHIACIEASAGELKRRLGRTEQPLAVMVKAEHLDDIARVSDSVRACLTGPEHPIAVMVKKDPIAHADISNLHTIGCMLPYTGLHHLLLSCLHHPFLVMTSANSPGYPMITDTDHAMSQLKDDVDFFLAHDRIIRNRCDDSVVRDGYIIRLSRGFAPKRTRIDLGDACILGVGPELNANITVYRNGFCYTSPHVGNVRNPATLEYLKETIETIGRLVGAEYTVIAHDLHPQFLSTRYAQVLAGECGAELVTVQHHKAHIAATTQKPCIGIAIDGVGYGDDGTVWGGEIFAGQAPMLDRVAHLEPVPMPGGDAAVRFPERMLYGILPGDGTAALLRERGWSDTMIDVVDRQIVRGVNTPFSSSTGRVLDAASALLGICREKTYDGEPAMKLESVASRGRAEPWELVFSREGGREVLVTRALMAEAQARMKKGEEIPAIAASFQYNLARGIAAMAIRAARTEGIPTVALSGGVAYNHAIRTTIAGEITAAGLECLINSDFPLGDGCISYGQCVWAGMLSRER
ncbi:MAG: hydrogenase maturation protein HypF [Methanoculleus sp. SDB]|nr:MAG: hydrogenase maturation protein HypF [Methanoculleus sp. SDB]